MILSLFFTSYYQVDDQIINVFLQNEFVSIPNGLILLPAITMTILYVFVGYFSIFLAQFESWGSQLSKNFAFIGRLVNTNNNSIFNDFLLIFSYSTAWDSIIS